MKHLLLLLLATLPVAAQAQVGVGTPTPDAKSALDIRATDKGLLIPRLTAAQRTGIVSPPQGLMVYQTDGTAAGGTQTGFWYYAGTGGWVFLDAGGGSGLTLPYSGTASTSSSVFQITNSGGGIGVRGASASGQGVVGRVNGTGFGQGVVGVKGTTVPNVDDAGVVGLSEADYGVYARSSQNSGVVGISDGTAAGLAGLVGSSTATTGVGVSGYAPGTGVLGVGSTGAGVDGTSSANSSATGGVVGRNSSGGSGVGVLGLTTTGYGVRGVASASGGYGVQGVATDSYALIGTSASGIGAQGTSTSNSGVRGNSNSGNGVYGNSSTNSGVYGTTAAGNVGGVAGVEGASTNSTGIGVLGTTASGYGVRGEASAASGYGVTGVANGNSGIGVYGLAASGTSANAVYALASGTGRAGYFNQNNSTSTANAVEAQNSSLGRTALFNQSNSGNAANALEVQNAGTGSTAFFNQSNASNTGTAVEIKQASTSNRSSALTLYHTTNADGLVVSDPSSFQVSTLSAYALRMINSVGTVGARIVVDPPISGAIFDVFSSSNNRAASFIGNVSVSGSLSKGGGSFKIDHPLDPENQYLYHSFVESPDMLNVYNGNVVLDTKGEATVTLPDYFEALNRDFRYQLTPIGAAFTPYVLAEVAGNKFRVAGQPGGKVSWQVTGIRHDKWADANRIPNAVPKEPENRGKFLHPKVFGLPAAQGIGYPSAEAALATPAGTSQHSTFTSSPNTTDHEE